MVYLLLALMCIGQVHCESSVTVEIPGCRLLSVRKAQALLPPPPPWRRLARRIAAVKSAARRAGTLRADQIAELIWIHCTDLDVYEVAALAWIESGFREDAIGPDGEDRGIFQLRRRWSIGIDAMDAGRAIPAACAKLRRWRLDCERWQRLCRDGSKKKICRIHNPKPHHFMAHWAGGTAAVATKGARKVVARAAILRAEGGVL